MSTIRGTPALDFFVAFNLSDPVSSDPSELPITYEELGNAVSIQTVSSVIIGGKASSHTGELALYLPPIPPFPRPRPSPRQPSFGTHTNHV